MDDRYRSILLFGPPGVGKGTQGKLIGQIPGFFHLATGEMFRGLDKDSDLGREVRSYSTKGELVPDELTVKLWKQHVQGLINLGLYRPTIDILLLDGIPRSVAQAQALDDIIIPLAILHLGCPDIDAMVLRMKGRAEKENRPDDASESVIRRRFDVYDQETAPVLGHYDSTLIYKINAVNKPVQVLSDILIQIGPLHDDSFINPLS
ncbi:MAG: nucleoside monophosphate kinase [Planctomycetota bacterium]|nr:nucleoside monophosphate kinase [Planctomycetota bacterium]